MGMAVRNSFEDVVLLRQVHRYVEEKAEIPAEQRERFRKDAVKFLEVMSGMADCVWSQSDHAWLSRRNRSILQQTLEGREELKRFDTAPLLMDGRVDRVTWRGGGEQDQPAALREAFGGDAEADRRVARLSRQAEDRGWEEDEA